jgi:hypothetical protein
MIATAAMIAATTTTSSGQYPNRTANTIAPISPSVIRAAANTARPENP